MASNALRHPRLRSAPSTVVPAKAGNQGLGGATFECARPETTRTDCLCRRPRSSILIAHTRRGTPSHPSSPTPTRDPPNVVPAKAGNQGLGGATFECARPEPIRRDSLHSRPRSSILIAHARLGTPSLRHPRPRSGTLRTSFRRRLETRGPAGPHPNAHVLSQQGLTASTVVPGPQSSSPTPAWEPHPTVIPDLDRGSPGGAR